MGSPVLWLFTWLCPFPPTPPDRPSELCEPMWHPPRHCDLGGPRVPSSRLRVKPGQAAGRRSAHRLRPATLWWREGSPSILRPSSLVFKKELILRLCGVAVRIKWENAPELPSPVPSTWSSLSPGEKALVCSRGFCCLIEWVKEKENLILTLVNRTMAKEKLNTLIVSSIVLFMACLNLDKKKGKKGTPIHYWF